MSRRLKTAPAAPAAAGAAKQLSFETSQPTQECAVTHSFSFANRVLLICLF